VPLAGIFMDISISTVLIALLALLLVAALPAWPYSSRWGFGPGGVLAGMLAVVIVLAMRGQI
jgi:hypothetical protein